MFRFNQFDPCDKLELNLYNTKVFLKKFSVSQSVLSMKFSYEIRETFRNIKTKVTMYVSNLVVRHAFEQKIKGRIHLSSPLSGCIVQYREPIGVGTFFF